MSPSVGGWASTCRATRCELDKFWDAVVKHREVLTESGDFAANRRQQQVDWMWTMVHEQLIDRLERDAKVAQIRGDVESRVREGTLTAARAAQSIIEAFDAWSPRFSGVRSRFLASPALHGICQPA